MSINNHTYTMLISYPTNRTILSNKRRKSLPTLHGSSNEKKTKNGIATKGFFLLLISSNLLEIFLNSSGIHVHGLAYKTCHATRISKKLYMTTPTSGDGKQDRVLPSEYFKSVYASKTPWDIGQAQPNVIRAFEEHKLKGRIIDAGCGKGENSLYLAQKGAHGGITSILGFDIAPAAIEIANSCIAHFEKEAAVVDHFWTRPQFLVASCTEVADIALTNDEDCFDVIIDSGLLHCLSDEDALLYIKQITLLIKPATGRAYVGCFSTANPDPWDNPRRLSAEYLRSLFSEENGWEVLDVRDTWWARPSARGSKQGGAFSMALWMEARRL